MGAYDEQIGRNLRRVRQELVHLDEAAVAFRMRLRGWPWDEHVVAAVEDGSRSILRDEASDLMSALGYSTAFITMRTDAESVAEIGDQLLVRAAAELHEAAEHWFEDAARFDLAGLPVPTTIERVLVEGREAFTDPDAVLGTPVPSPDGVPASITLAEWEDLPERPPHPLDTIGIDVPWNDEQLLQYGHDLRETSDAVGVAVVEWLRAAAARAPHWPDDTPRSPEQIVEDVRALRNAD
ncbi:hypothetical protein ACIPC2_17135 [Curtobacterium pusillum]|uniref:hypothetical protein n=1 Tax=Curtobacterium pusillum TaxID=69373 RepID=UPI00380E9808